jgi:hypothetical protein
MTRLFELWAREMFFAAVDARWAALGSRGMVLLLPDGFGSPQ